MTFVPRTNLKGPTGTIDTATAVVLPNGSDPVVTLGGTPAHRSMEFGIPKGDQGIRGLPGFDGLPADTAMAEYISTPGTAARGAVNTVIANTVAATDDRMTALGAFAAQDSAGRSRIRYEDAGSLVERWADLTAWAANGGQVSGGKFFSTVSTSICAANRAFSVGPTDTARIRASITLVEPAASGLYTLVGISNHAAGVAPTASAGFVGLGFTSANVPTLWGASTGVPITSMGAAVAAGTYYLTTEIDPTNISFTITNAAGDYEVSATFTRNAAIAQINNVMVWNSDSRKLTGHSVNHVGARRAPVTMLGAERPGIEGAAPSVLLGVDAAARVSQFIRVSLPTNYDSRKPSPLVLFAHGSGGDHNTAIEARLRTTAVALAASGYIVASSNQFGTNWGNQDGIDSLVTLYQKVRERYSIGPVILLGLSMGGLTSLLTLVERRIPGIVGWAGIYPVTNLAAEIGNFSGVLYPAYGIPPDGTGYAEKTAGHDPNLIPGSAFRGVPMRFYASPDDTAVRANLNSTLFAAKFDGKANEHGIVVCSGPHGDPSHFIPADLIAFFDRCLARAVS